MNGAPTFAQQRLVSVGMLLGMTFFAVVVAVLLQANEGKGLATEPLAILDTIAMVAGASLAVAALLLRPMLHGAAERAQPDQRPMLRFRAVLVPLAALEGGCLLALTAWLLNGNAVPSLVAAMVLLALAIAIVPFSDPDERRPR